MVIDHGFRIDITITTTITTTVYMQSVYASLLAISVVKDGRSEQEVINSKRPVK